jgi:signal transduction histidine kinase
LEIFYEDDGVGVQISDKKKIFMEGYGEGTGYGLYLIRKMCDVYGWTINETGEPGKGVQFSITIPRMNENRDELYRTD